MLIDLKELTSGDENLESGKEWLIHEVLQTLSDVPETTMEGIKMKGNVNVQIMLDGVVMEPKLLSDIYTNIEKYIDIEANLLLERLLDQKMEEIDAKFSAALEPLEKIVHLTKEKIKKDFNIQ
jgi:hypothetical protein